MNKELEDMARDLAMKGYSANTQKSYLNTAQQLIARFDAPAAKLEQEQLRQFVQELHERVESAGMRNRHLAAVLFLYRKTLGKPEVVSFISLSRVHSALPVILSLKEVHSLFNAILNPRYQAIAMVMYGAGLRVMEALTLQVGDIDGARGVIRVRQGKGNRPREAKLSPQLHEWLREYWSKHQPAGPHLFASPSTGKLPQSATLRKALKKAAKDAWIKKVVTPHTLRHSFATHLLEQGTDVHVVSALLGHASLKSTTRYARVTRKIVRETPSPLDLLPQRRFK